MATEHAGAEEGEHDKASSDEREQATASAQVGGQGKASTQEAEQAKASTQDKESSQDGEKERESTSAVGSDQDRAPPRSGDQGEGVLTDEGTERSGAEEESGKAAADPDTALDSGKEAVGTLEKAPEPVDKAVDLEDRAVDPSDSVEKSEDKQDEASPAPGVSGEEASLEAATCDCEDESGPGGKRLAEVRTVVSAKNANKGLRYWACASYETRNWQQRWKKKRKKATAEGEADEKEVAKGCNFFRWIDQPVQTKEEREKAKKERVRKRELALLA